MLELYKPHIEDLWFKEKMMSDEQTMAYNHAYGGTIPFPKEYWADWHDRWIINHNNKRFDGERQIYIADVIIYAPYRGKGYGRNGLLLLCETAKGNGIMELYDDIAIDNSSVALFLKCGFVEVLRTTEYVLVKKEL